MKQKINFIKVLLVRVYLYAEVNTYGSGCSLHQKGIFRGKRVQKIFLLFHANFNVDTKTFEEEKMHNISFKDYGGIGVIMGGLPDSNSGNRQLGDREYHLASG